MGIGRSWRSGHNQRVAVSRNVRQGLLWVSLAAAVFALTTPIAVSRAGAQEAKVRLEVPSGDVGVDDAPFTVDVIVEDVANLGGFEFNLRYDSSILGLVNVDRGPFLGSSGRTVECLDPRLTLGFVRFVCVTLGPMPPGADGSGVLATLTFDPAGPGTSPLRFDGAILARLDGQRIPAAVEDASITVVSPSAQQSQLPAASPPAATPAHLTPVEATPIGPTPILAGTPAATNVSSDGGTNWLLWGSVIGGAAILLVAAVSLAWWSRARKLP